MDQEQDEIDEDHVEELANARAKTMLQEMLSKDFVGRPQVEKMESLYDDVVKKLKNRVERLEKKELVFKEKRTKKKTKRQTRREARRHNAVRMRYGNVGVVRGNRQRGSSHIARVRDVRTKNRASRSMNQEDRRAAAAARRKELMMMKQKKSRTSKPGRGSSATAARLQGRSVYANAIRSGIGRKKNGGGVGGIVGVRGVRRRRRNGFR